jgi:hypothetical protein
MSDDDERGGARGADAPLVDGAYNPTYRSAKLARYAREGYRRAVKSVAPVIDELYRDIPSYFLREKLRESDWSYRIVDALVNAGCLDFISGGIAEENERDAKERERRKQALNARPAKRQKSVR